MTSPDPYPPLGLMGREDELRALWATGREGWPDIDIDEASFVEWLSARLDPELDPGKLVAADLYLCCGCLLGVAGATTRFVEGPLAAAARRAPRLSGGDAAVEDLLQDLAVLLLTPGPAGEPPRLTQYSGRGALAVWLRMTVTRRALNADRGRARTVSLEDVDWEQAGGRDPELSALRRHHRPELAAVFAEAAAATPLQDRTLLRLHYVQGSTLSELAALYQTSRSAMHRRIEAARAELMERVRLATRARMQLTASEYGSLMLMFRSDVRDMMGRLLRED